MSRSVPGARLAVCVDLGSTFTKALLVDLVEGGVVATADAPTTLPGPDGSGDLLDGYDACLTALRAAHPPLADAEAAGDVVVHACSSAGGGLRIAVLGNEALVTAEAGRRVALSSGGKVVAVHALADGGADLAATLATAPDVVLLTGGTDGGNPEPLPAAARALVAAGWRGPVVVAGNVAVRDEVAAVLAGAGTPYELSANVVPRIGVLDPAGARAAVRALFLSHVIGGKHLSRRPELPGMLRGATPDVVLAGVEVLAATVGDVAVVDVGGATTDVYSVVDGDPDVSREVVGTPRESRTVEGDLGMRWSAASTVAALAADATDGGAPSPALVAAAARRTAEPGFVPQDAADVADDLAIATAALTTAVRRHAGRAKVVVDAGGRVVERTGTDLREVRLLVGSGGVLRHASPQAATEVLAACVTGPDGDPGGWQLPRAPGVVVDTTYVLAAAGLLHTTHPEAASRLVAGLVGGAAR